MLLDAYIVCNDPQEPRDEIYVKIDNSQVAGTWGSVSEGSIRHFSKVLPDERHHFSLYEKDRGRDDLLGDFSVLPPGSSNTRIQKQYLNKSSGKYTVLYLVTPS